MKKITTLIFGIILTVSFIPAHAQVLSNAQLEGITAGQLDTTIDDIVDATNSAISSQKNIGAIGSTDGAVSDGLIDNLNTAEVTGFGDAAVALQTNIGAIAASGSATGNIVLNANTALVDNLVGVPADSAILNSQSDTAGADINSILSDVDAHGSAVASQANIAAIVSLEGDASGNLVDNINDANLLNTGDSAVALQTNISAIAGLGTGASSDENMIANTNTALVSNEVILDAGATTVSQASSTESDALNSIFSDVTAQVSAVVSQSNIGVILGAGGVSGATIVNSNSAIVDNLGL